MLVYFLYIITGFTGFLILFIINTKYRKLSHVNKYLQIVIGVASTRFLFNGAGPFYNTNIFNAIITTFDTITIVTIPCFYLYSKDLVNEQPSEKISLKHFIIPIILVFIFLFSFIAEENYKEIFKSIYGFSFILVGFFYCFIGFRFLNMNVWSKKSEFKSNKAHEKIIYFWTLTLFICACLLIFRLSIGIIVNKLFLNNKTPMRAMWMGSIIWLSLFIKLLMTPEILYGYNMLSKKIEEFAKPEFAMDIIWSITPTIEISNIKDQKLTEKIAPYINQHLRKIEDASFLNHLLRNPDAGIDEIAKELKVPNSHVTYLFKYHCKESFSDFKKIVRIQDAITFLKSSYLESHTLESLAIEVGFTSYTSFFLSFKEIMGMPPQDYAGRG